MALQSTLSDWEMHRLTLVSWVVVAVHVPQRKFAEAQDHDLMGLRALSSGGTPERRLGRWMYPQPDNALAGARASFVKRVVISHTHSYWVCLLPWQPPWWIAKEPGVSMEPASSWTHSKSRQLITYVNKNSSRIGPLIGKHGVSIMYDERQFRAVHALLYSAVLRIWIYIAGRAPPKNDKCRYSWKCFW